MSASGEFFFVSESLTFAWKLQKSIIWMRFGLGKVHKKRCWVCQCPPKRALPLNLGGKGEDLAYVWKIHTKMTASGNFFFVSESSTFAWKLHKSIIWMRFGLGKVHKEAFFCLPSFTKTTLLLSLGGKGEDFVYVWKMHTKMNVCGKFSDASESLTCFNKLHKNQIGMRFGLGKAHKWCFWVFQSPPKIALPLILGGKGVRHLIVGFPHKSDRQWKILFCLWKFDIFQEASQKHNLNVLRIRKSTLLAFLRLSKSPPTKMSSP